MAIKNSNTCLYLIFGVISFLLHAAQPVSAQKERKEIRSGNIKYENGKYTEAETDYRKAIEKNRSSFPGSYNLGGALYKQNKFDEAIQQYSESAAKASGSEEKANSLHNLGNALVKAEKFQEGVNAYKEALKLNPAADDTRYNLAYAQSMLKQQQQQQQQQGDDNKDKNQQQEKQDSKNEQNKNQESENQKESAEQDDQKREQQKEQARKQSKISKEDAERLLKALQNDEQNLQEKMQRKEGQKIKVEKDW